MPARIDLTDALLALIPEDGEPEPAGGDRGSPERCSREALSQEALIAVSVAGNFGA